MRPFIGVPYTEQPVGSSVRAGITAASYAGGALGMALTFLNSGAVELWSSAEALRKCDQRRSHRMAPCQDPSKSVMYHEVTYENSTLYNSMMHP